MTSGALQTQTPASRLAIEDRSAAQAEAPVFTARQKAALIIAALGPDAAGPIIERIGDKHLKAFAEAYARLDHVAQRDMVAVAAEFVSQLSGESRSVKGGFEQARQLVSHFKGEEDAIKLLDGVDAPGGRSVWQKLEAIDNQAIADYLAQHSAQSVAVALSRLNLDKASSVLACLPKDMAENVLARLAKPMRVRREALNVLAATIEDEFLRPMRTASKASGPGAMIGALLNNLSDEMRTNMLQFIEAKSPDIMEDVMSAILTFKDIPARVPPKAISQVIREVDVQVFLKAAKYGRKNAPETVEFMFANISQRMVQQYEEQMQELKPVTVAEAEAAQAQIMTAVRKLVSEDVFELVTIATEEEASEEEFI